MGHDITTFLVQPVDVNFICGICQDVLCGPTTVCAEGHTFCAACVEASKQQPAFRCPICRCEPLTAFALNRPIQNMIDELNVRCPHGEAAGDEQPKPKRSKKAASSSSQEPSKCLWRGQLKDLQAHLRACPFEAVDCPLGCGVKASRNELDAHQQTCPRRKVKCDQGCGIEVRADLLAKHKAQTCQETMLICYECKEEMKRSAIGTAIRESRHLSIWPIMQGPRSKFWFRTQVFDEVTDELSGHLKTCPKIKLRCPHYCIGCRNSFTREEAAAHHSAFAHEHACLVQTYLKELKDEREWEPMDVTFRIRAQRLVGDRAVALKSACCTVAGKEMYIKLEAGAQNSPVRVSLCAEEPRWTPVRVKSLRIFVSLKDGMFEEDGCLKLGFSEDGRGLSTNLEGSPDPSLGGALKCRRKGARIEYDDEDSGADSEYEYDEDTVTRKDLLDGASDAVLEVHSSFLVKKCNVVTVQCR